MMGTDCLFCENTLEGGWWFPVLEKPPGIFVEQCPEDDQCLFLTEAEFIDLVVPLWRKIESLGWTRTGFEAGRGYGAINVKAHVFDFISVVRLADWRFGDSPPTGEYRRWAIEFLDSRSGKYSRRAFWVVTRYEVPDLDELGRCRVERTQEQRERNKERREERLKYWKLQKCQKQKVQRLQEGQLELL